MTIKFMGLSYSAYIENNKTLTEGVTLLLIKVSKIGTL